MGASIRVLLADDHPIVQAGIEDVCGYGGDMELVGVAQGGHWFSESVFVVLGLHKESTPANQLLTPRESEILDLIGEGYDNQQIADELCLAKQTVANAISCIYEKLGFQSRAEAILWQVENRAGK